MSEKNHSSGKVVLFVKKRGFLLLKEDIKKYGWAILLYIACLLLFKMITGAACPVVGMTGYPCPGCGLTRAGIFLLRLEWKAAFSMHPFIFALVGYGMLWAGNRYILGRDTGKALYFLLFFLLILMCFFFVWRMFQYFPHKSPLTFYHNHLGQRIRLFLNKD